MKTIPGPMAALTLSEYWLSAAQAPTCAITAITYPSMAADYFRAVGDTTNEGITRGLLARNRLAIGFDVLRDRVLFDGLDDLQNAWIDRNDPRRRLVAPHVADDYDTVADIFSQAVEDAKAAPYSEWTEAITIAGGFRAASLAAGSLERWVAAMQVVFPDRGMIGDVPVVSLLLLSARLYAKRGALDAAVHDLRRAAELAGTEREQGFIRYSAALALLLNPDDRVENGEAAIAELKSSIASFRRSEEAFPKILYKRLSETHDRLGREYYERGQVLSAAQHFSDAKNIEEATSARLPIARLVTKTLPKNAAKRGRLSGLAARLFG